MRNGNNNSSGNNASGTNHDWHAEQTLLDENDRRADALAAKLALLRGHASDIKRETDRSHTVLDGLGTDFSSAQDLLGNTLSRVQNFSARAAGDRRLMCYIIGGSLLGFVFIYYILMSLARTNNAVEGWHSGLRKRAGVRMNVFALIGVLAIEFTFSVPIISIAPYILHFVHLSYLYS